MIWKPTLAATLPAGADLRALPYPLYASPKIDGVRATVQGGKVLTRNGTEIRNLQVRAKFGGTSYEGLDGELTAGQPYASDVFNATVRVTQKRDADAGGVRFNVFDYRVPGTFRDRLGLLTVKFNGQGVNIVRQTRITGPDQLVQYERATLDKGYEGVMLRRCDAGAYLDKRSTVREFALVKLKRFDYGEAKIQAIYYLEHNLNEERVSGNRRSSKKSGLVVDKERVGRAVLEDVKTKCVFGVSVAGDQAQLWPGWQDGPQWLGRVVRYKYQNVGMKGETPRFPTATFEELLG